MFPITTTHVRCAAIKAQIGQRSTLVVLRSLAMEAARVPNDWTPAQGMPNSLQWNGPLSPTTEKEIELFKRAKGVLQVPAGWLQLPALSLSEGGGKRFMLKELIEADNGQDHKAHLYVLLLFGCTVATRCGEYRTISGGTHVRTLRLKSC